MPFEDSTKLLRATFLACGIAIAAHLLERSAGLLFSLSLASLGVNASLALAVLLFSGFVYPLGLYRLWPHSGRTLAACWFALAVLALMSAASSPTVAALGTFGGVIAITPPLVHAIRRDRDTVILGLGLGLATYVLFRSLNDTAPFGATTLGLALLGLLSAGAILGGMHAATPKRGELPPTGSLGTVGAVFGFLYFEAIFLAAPWSQSLFYAKPSWASGEQEELWLLSFVAAVQVGIVAGTLLGLKLARVELKVSPALPVVVYSVVLVGMLWFAPLSTVPVFALAAQLAGFAVVGSFAGHASTTDDPKKMGRNLGLLQLGFVGFLVLYAVARAWPFFPEALWPLIRGTDLFFLGCLGLLFLLGGVAGKRKAVE